MKLCFSHNFRLTVATVKLLMSDGDQLTEDQLTEEFGQKNWLQ